MEQKFHAVFLCLQHPPERGAADAEALRRTALVVAAFFQYHSDDLPLDEGQRLGEVERGGGGGRRIRVGGRKGKLRLQGGLNVRQPDLCIRAQFRQPFHHAVELQIVLRPRILAQQRKRIRVDARATACRCLSYGGPDTG